MYPDKDQLVILFFLQLLAILATCRVVGWLGKRFLGQTQTVGEMVAGILLGPSLFGLLAPRAQGWLFPMALTDADGSAVMVHGAKVLHPSMAILYAVAQLGLTLYMFVVGMEFNAKLLSRNKAGAGSVSIVGMAVPLLLGTSCAWLLADQVKLFGDGVKPWAGALYLGAAMSITAFPTLARILHEKGIARTRVGTLSLAAGAGDDAMAWVLLAVVLSVFQGDKTIAMLAIGGGLAYVGFTLTVGRRLLKPLGARAEREGLTPGIMAIVLLALTAGAGITEAIRLYAVFGAFILGCAMPRGALTEKMTDKLEPFLSTFLLPVFFVYSGLNTEIGLLDSPALWLAAGVLLLAAIVGKGAGCLLAAKASGESWKDSLGIGILMNTRGLMELIILNIGLQQKIISRELFTMMVIMAVLTTLMTSPLINWLFPGKHAPDLPLPHEA